MAKFDIRTFSEIGQLSHLRSARSRPCKLHGEDFSYVLDFFRLSIILFCFEGHAKGYFIKKSPWSCQIPFSTSESARPLLPLSRWSCSASALALASSSSCRFLGVFPIARSWRFLPPDPAGSGRRSYSPVLARTFLLARCAALKERCPPRQKSRVERLKAKVEPLLTQVTVDHTMLNEKAHRPGGNPGAKRQFL